MTTQTLDEILDVLSEEIPDDLQHGAHLLCQRGAAFVVTVCGIAMEWHERSGDDEELPRCSACYEALRCPVCGTVLMAES